MADAKHGGFLGAVYDAAKPEDVAKLYDGWAETYDGDERLSAPRDCLSFTVSASATWRHAAA